MRILWSPKNPGAGKTALKLAQERGKAIVNWWAGRSPLLHSSKVTSTNNGRIWLASFEGERRSLIGGLKKKHDYWLSFEQKGEQKLVHVFEMDKKSLVNSFYLVKNGEILRDPEPARKSPRQLAKERGQTIAQWWAGSGPPPSPFETTTSGGGSISFITFKDKRQNLRGGLGKNTPCWITFEETENNKLIYVYAADKKTLMNSFYLVRDGEVLEGPEPVQKSPQQLSRERGLAILNWWKSTGPFPQAFKSKINKSRAVKLVSRKGAQAILQGKLGINKPCWISFEEKENNKLVHIYAADKKTLMNSFYLVRDGEVLEGPEPVQKSTRQIARKRGQKITDWWKENGPLPQAIEAESTNERRIFLTDLDNKHRYLSSQLKETHPYWITFEQRRKDKLAHVFEADKKTLVNSFYLVKNGELLKDPQPIQKSPIQLAKERGQTIAEWVMDKGPLPQPFETTTTKEGGIQLISLEGKQRILRGGLEKDKPCWITFGEKENHKLVHVFEADKKTLINSFYLIKNGQVLENPAPTQKSQHQLAQERGRIIVAWWKSTGPLPQAFEYNTKGGSISLTTYRGNRATLHGDLKSDKPCWISFEKRENDKLVHIYAADKQTLMNSFYLVKDGEVLEDPEPVQKSPLQLAKERGISIAKWWGGDGPVPQAFEMTTSRDRRITFTFEGQARSLVGGLKKNKPCWVTFEAKVNSKIVHIYESDKKTLMNSFYLVKDDQVLENPDPVNKSSTQLALERGKSIKDWWLGKALSPAPFQAESGKTGKIELVRIREKTKILTSNIKKNQSYWIIFEEKNGDKIIHVYKLTFIVPDNNGLRVNSFYVVKNGKILDAPEPIQKSSRQLGLERGRAITQWWKGKGPIPQSFEAVSSKGGIFLATPIKRKPKYLRGVKEGETYWVSFIQTEGSKIALVYEKDKIKLAKAFYLVKDGIALDKLEPVEEAKKKALEGKRPKKKLSRHYVAREKRAKRKPSTRQITLTERQKLRQGIGRGDFDGIADAYKEQLLGIAAYWATLARNSLLLQLVDQEKISPFQRELSLGAGPSTSHIVWQNLSRDVTTVDLELSQNMLLQGSNPLKVRADMEAPLPFPDNTFDLVTSDSSIRYIKPESRFSLLQEVRRVLKDNGILSITQLGVRFDLEFVQSLRDHLGFNNLTPADYRMALDKDFKKDLSRNYSPEVAQTIASFLRHCGTLIATKEDRSLPEPKPIPLFELRPIREHGRVAAEDRAIIGSKSALNLGNYDALTRSFLDIQEIDIQERRARKRVEQTLSKKIKDPVLRSQITQVVMNHSARGHLLEIARDPEKLSNFNVEIAKFGFELRLIKRGQVAHLEKISKKRPKQNGY